MSDTRYKIRLWRKKNPDKFDRLAATPEYSQFREQLTQAGWVGMKWYGLGPVIFLAAIVVGFAFQFTPLRTLFATPFVLGALASVFWGMYLNYKADAPMWPRFLEIVDHFDESETRVGD